MLKKFKFLESHYFYSMKIQAEAGQRPENESPGKLHTNLMVAIEQVLVQTLVDGFPANKVISRIFKHNPQWGSRDRGFIAGYAYDIIRYLRHYTEGFGPSTNWKAIIATHLARQGYDLKDKKDWIPITPAPSIPQPDLTAKYESITDWFDRMGSSAWGARWPSLMASLNQPAALIARVNPLKTTLNELRAELSACGIDSTVIGEDSLEINNKVQVYSLDAFQKGWFEVQDFASQQIAPMLDIVPGQTIIDACAGAGGKTLHLAALSKNKGKIIALDVSESKLEELRKRAVRAGADNIIVRHISDNKVIKRLIGKADRLLLDVPCTGSGVIRRNPDTKWKINQTVLERCVNLQYEILRKYHRICKPGGKILYATCSVIPAENQDQIASFLSEFPSYSLIREGYFLPDDFGYDGFYYALIQTPDA